MHTTYPTRHGSHHHRHHRHAGLSRSSAQVDARVVVAVVGILFGGLAIGCVLTLYRLLSPGPLPPMPGTVRLVGHATRVPEALPSLEARVYPYSVVPGGVRTGNDVARAVAADPVVAKHYAGVQVGRLRRVRLAAPRNVSVSYRVGNRVYWTRRPVRLQAGEEILTDGRVEIRPRCGNCVSLEPRGETRPDEPATATLDTPTVGPETPTDPLRDPLIVVEALAGPTSWPRLDPTAAPAGEWAPIGPLDLPGGAAPGSGTVTAATTSTGLPLDVPLDDEPGEVPGNPGGEGPGDGDPGDEGRGGGGPGDGGTIPGGGPGGGGGSGGSGGSGGGGTGDTPGDGPTDGGEGPDRVPEPGGLVAAGLAAAAWVARRRAKRRP